MWFGKVRNGYNEFNGLAWLGMVRFGRVRHDVVRQGKEWFMNLIWSGGEWYGPDGYGMVR